MHELNILGSDNGIHRKYFSLFRPHQLLWVMHIQILAPENGSQSKRRVLLLEPTPVVIFTSCIEVLGSEYGDNF